MSLLIYQVCHQDNEEEIALLELQLIEYEKLLDESIMNNAVLAESKIIFHNLRIISQRLIELKKPKE